MSHQMTIQQMSEKRFSIEERLKPIPEEKWFEGIYMVDPLRNPVLVDKFANWLLHNDRHTILQNGNTVKEYAQLLRKAPTMMRGDTCREDGESRVESAVKEKFYEIVSPELQGSYADYFYECLEYGFSPGYFEMCERCEECTDCKYWSLY